MLVSFVLSLSNDMISSPSRALRSPATITMYISEISNGSIFSKAHTKALKKGNLCCEKGCFCFSFFKKRFFFLLICEKVDLWEKKIQ